MDKTIISKLKKNVVRFSTCFKVLAQYWKQHFNVKRN